MKQWGSRKAKVNLSPMCLTTFRTVEVDKWKVLARNNTTRSSLLRPARHTLHF